jgi:hypothetical protein
MKSIPFEFMFEELTGLPVRTRPMFGCLSVYVGEKIMFIQRLKGAPAEDDGVWVATVPEHHASLRSEFPNLRSIGLFGPGETGWQVLPADAEDFEASVVRACELVRKGDQRIGKIPKGRGVKRGAAKKSPRRSK